MEDKIMKAVVTTLVIDNKQSILILRNKIKALLDKEKKK